MLIDPGQVKNKARQILIARAREDFYTYCRVKLPGVYTKDRPDLKELCRTLQLFWEGGLFKDGKVVDSLMINMPPRVGKSLTAENLVQWAIGKSPQLGHIVVSYNKTLSNRFAKAVRNPMMERSGEKIVYSDIFPGVEIKDGDGAIDLWSVKRSHFTFLATSPDATLTGNGATGLFIMDDVIKDALEAYNETILENHWHWYTDTALSRMEPGCKQLAIMTRWAGNDLCGRLQREEPGKWYVIKMRANKRFPDNPESDADMLAPSVLSFSEYIDRKSKTDEMIFSANYDQEPIDTRDRLYFSFKTYTSIPENAKRYNYTDTADEGQDFLCSINYALHGKLCYIENVIYTQEAMETTEGQVAAMLTRDQVVRADIESNNGGRGFARAVERIMRENGNTKTRVEWFHQGENKQARILTNSTGVNNCIIMPENWHLLWPKFYRDLMGLSRSSKWLHDDAPDALTGVYEKGILTAKEFKIL